MADDAPDVAWERAALIPSNWYVRCPTCGHCVEDIDVAEDNAGAYCPAPEEQFLICEACGGGIEAVPVSVAEAYPPTGKAADA